MSSLSRTFLIAAAMSMVAGMTAAMAAPNKSFGACDTGAEHAICAQVALCQRSGGEPHRSFFSTSLTCCIGDHCAPISGLTARAAAGGAGADQ